MSECQRCDSARIADVSGKCSDLFGMSLSSVEVVECDYVPRDIGIGGGDYINFAYCLDCGQMQGDWPLENTELDDDASEGTRDHEELDYDDE